MHRWRFLARIREVILGLSLALATLALANPLNACNGAKTKLATYVATLPASCAESADCAALNFAADSCAPAFPLRKEVTADDHLKSLQAAVGEACGPVFRKRAACAPPPVTVGCQAGRCVDLRLGKHRE